MPESFRVNLYRQKTVAKDQPKVLKDHFYTLDDTLDDTLENRIFKRLSDNPMITQAVLAQKTGKSIATIKRAIGKLSDEGHITRVDGKRFGHWEINK